MSMGPVAVRADDRRRHRPVVWWWWPGRARARARAVASGTGVTAMRQIFLDTETTGLSSAESRRPNHRDRWRRTRATAATRTNDPPLRQPRARQPSSTRTPCTASPTSSSPTSRSSTHVAHEIDRVPGGAEIIIHNAAFDVGFLDAELRPPRPRASPRATAARVTDSLTMARDIPGQSQLARRVVQTVRGQQRDARPARRAARCGSARRGVPPHDARAEALVIDDGARPATISRRGHRLSRFLPVLAAAEDDLKEHAPEAARRYRQGERR